MILQDVDVDVDIRMETRKTDIIGVTVVVTNNDWPNREKKATEKKDWTRQDQDMDFSG